MCFVYLDIASKVILKQNIHKKSYSTRETNFYHTVMTLTLKQKCLKEQEHSHWWALKI